jgi:hypothetical protein
MYTDLYSLEKNQKLYAFIQRFIIANRHLDPDILFKNIWEELSAQNIFDKYTENKTVEGQKYFFTPYQLNFKQYILLLICTSFYFSEINFIPRVIPQNTTLLEELSKTTKSFLVVMVHDGFAHGSSAFQKMGRPINIIGDQESSQDAIKKSGLQAEVNIIRPSQFALAFLQERIKHQEILSCNVDFRVSRDAQSGIYQYISPALFKFAILNNIPIIYTRGLVNKDGSVNLFLRKGSDYLNESDLAAEFIKFINEVDGNQRILSVRKFLA